MNKRGMGALLLALLLAFGAAGAMAEATPGEATCDHNWSNGECTKCGATCSHEKREFNGKGTQRNTVYVDNGDGTHTRSFDVYHFYECTVCGDVEERYIERGDEVESHVWNSDDKCSCGAVKPCEHDWSDGVCTKCGATCSHEKREFNGKGTQKNTVYVDNGNGTHTRSFDVYHFYECTVCGDVEERYIERGYEDEAHVWNSDDKCSCGAVKPCEHDWSDGVCTKCGVTCSHDWSNKDGVCKICGYVCLHPDNLLSDRVTSYDVQSAASEGDSTHTCYYDVYEEYSCACGKEFREFLRSETKSEPHEWEDGVCALCDHICEHPQELLTFIEEKSVVLETVTNESTHTLTYGYYSVYDCACGKEVRALLRSETETQPHTWSDGKCTDCGYECLHPMTMLTFNEEESWEEPLPSVVENENTHTDHYILHDVLDCACGKQVMPAAHEGSAANKPHNWSDGKCTDCGYVCQHTLIGPDGDPIRTDGEAEYFNEDVHIQHYTTEQKMKCDICGSKAESLYGTGKDGSVQHVYVNGQCVCGAKKPASSSDGGSSSGTTGGGTTGGGTTGGGTTGGTTGAEQTPAAEEEELIFEQAEPAPKPAMVEKLVETVAQAEASGSEVKVEVVGAQQVMTETEYAQLKTLSVQEQILVTLASIGFEEVVGAAVETMSNVELSGDALELMDSISTRMTAASAEEREEMETKLAKYFPVREIEVNGVTYPYFVMELQIEVDGELTIQRYGFRMDENGEWIFVMLNEL